LYVFGVIRQLYAVEKRARQEKERTAVAALDDMKLRKTNSAARMAALSLGVLKVAKEKMRLGLHP
jgi:hypothetical protein